MSTSIQTGDVVTLKFHENAPDMTVERIIGLNVIEVVWFDKKDRLRRDRIQENLLAKVSL